MLFSTYGPVLDIVALKTMKMRGQAHVVFRDVQASTQAMRALDGQMFLGRQLVWTIPCPVLIISCVLTQLVLMQQKIQYAKSKSNFVAKLDGTFKIPNVGVGAATVEQTELQQSIFNAPPPAAGATTGPGLVSKPNTAADRVMDEAASPESRGQKRARSDEGEDESEEDVAMEEDSDDE